MHNSFLSIILIASLSTISYAKSVHTPAGDMPEECVHEVPHHSVIEADGHSVTFPDGSKHAFPACTTQTGFRSSTVPTSSTSTWVEYAYASNGGNFSYMTGNWTVPYGPSVSSGQTLYYFNGLTNNSCIIQPVLGWNGNGTGARWSMASWVCCPNTTTGCYHSTTIPIYMGHSLTGTMSLNGSTWGITTTDHTTAQSTTLYVSAAAAGGTQVWGYGAVMETYGITYCSQYSASSYTYFTGTSVINQGLRSTPLMYGSVEHNDSCGEGVVIPTSGNVELRINASSGTTGGGTGGGSGGCTTSKTGCR
jgi:hypothetical protein